MVYKGPSRGCHTCRRRRVKVSQSSVERTAHPYLISQILTCWVKCDEARPQCGNCVKRKQQCSGYRDFFDAVHRSETFDAVQKDPKASKDSSKQTSPKNAGVDQGEDADVDDEGVASEVESWELFKPSSHSTPSSQFTPSSSLLLRPSRSFETESLSYFIANYVNIPRDPSTNVFIEHILPLYIHAPLHSALAQAVNAVAINVTQMWMSRFDDSYLARETYGKAVAQVNAALQDPVLSKSDDTLAAVFMLDFYDSLNKRFVGFIDTGTHQQGAVALLRHRGKANFSSPTSQRLFTAMRSRHINFCLQAGQRVQLEEELLAEDTAILPSAKLDMLNAELADLHVMAYEGPEGAGLDLVDFYRAVMKEALRLDQKVQDWKTSLPKSWQPMPVPVSELHPSIRAAGVFENLCDVYSSLEVSHVNNASRSTHMGALRLVALCKRELEALGEEVDPQLGPHLATRAQEIVDRFCATMPYHLGNRTTLTFPHEHREYPRVPLKLRRLATYVDPFGNPVDMTEEDHIRAAAAIGGWFVLTPLTGLLRSPFLKTGSAKPGPLVQQLRPGQLAWIRDQMLRCQKIYALPRQMAGGWSYPFRQLRLSSRTSIFQETSWNRQLWQV